MPELARQILKMRKAQAAIAAAMVLAIGGGVAAEQACGCTTPTFPDVTAPTVSVTAPANGATVSSLTTVTASASDDIAVVGVQFKLDSVALQTEDTSAPYSISWDTSTATNGTHLLTATARDAAGNSSTSGSITVTVSNVVAPPPPTGTANIFIDQNATHNCVRSASLIAYTGAGDTNSCTSMQAAQTAMAAGDTAIMVCGAYAAQAITTGGKASTVNYYAQTYDSVSTAAQAFTATSCATVANLAVAVDKIHIYGIQATPAPDATRTDAVLTYQFGGGLLICAQFGANTWTVTRKCTTATTTDILVDGYHGRFFFSEGDNVVLDHVVIGGFDECFLEDGTHVTAAANNPQDGARFWAGSNGSATPQSDTLRNSVIHDQFYNVNNSEFGCGIGLHQDCMQNNGGNNVTIANNIFFNCPSNNIQWQPFAGATMGRQDIYGNFFGPTACCNNLVLGTQSAGGDCSAIHVYNNIEIGSPNPTTGCTLGKIDLQNNFIYNMSCANSAFITFANNAAHSGVCGSGTNKTCDPTFTSAWSPSFSMLGTIPNPHIQTSDTCLKASATGTLFPASDLDGDLRPGNDGLQSIGPDEVG